MRRRGEEAIDGVDGGNGLVLDENRKGKGIFFSRFKTLMCVGWLKPSEGQG